MWSFVFYLDRAQSPTSSCFYGVSVHRGETVQPGVHPSPASTLQYHLLGRVLPFGGEELWQACTLSWSSAAGV